MSKVECLPEFNSYDEMAEFWDTHSLADYWEQTEPSEFKISPQARRRYLKSIDRHFANYSNYANSPTGGLAKFV